MTRRQELYGIMALIVFIWWCAFQVFRCAEVHGRRMYEMRTDDAIKRQWVTDIKTIKSTHAKYKDLCDSVFEMPS